MKSYISACLALFLLVGAIDLELVGQNKQVKPPPKQQTPPPPTPPKQYNPPQKPTLPKIPNNPGTGDANRPDANNNDGPAKLDLSWQSESLSAAVNTAAQDKKVVFVYFFFKDKDDFPPNYDAKFQKLSAEKYIFAKVWVATDKDKNGRAFISDGNAEFFRKHNQSLSPVGVALDPYGNLMDKLAPPMSGPKVTPFLEMAEKKYQGILADLNSRYDKSEKLLSELESTPEKELEARKMKLIPEAVRMLNSIVSVSYEGYPAIGKAEKKLGRLDKEGRGAYFKLMKDYVEIDPALRSPKHIMPELEKLTKTYKGLPVEQEIKNDMKEIKAGKIPEGLVQELEKQAEPAADEAEPKEDDKEPLLPDNQGAAPEPDKE